MKAGSTLDGKYQLRRRLGSGAMGEVWEAFNTRTEREVAVKLLSGMEREQDRSRLLREARAGGRIRHPNVLDVYDVAETETGSPFIVMELLRGETLAEALASAPLSLSRALLVLRDVARGLAAAHKVGVTHRDLKPHNIFLQKEADTDVPTVKLVEFGISRIDSEATLTLSGVTLGSPGYVAPEQINGREIDKRADIWAFGALAYELFSGDPAFDGSDPAEIVQQVMAGPIPELPRIAHEVDGDLRALVGGALVRDVDRRFQSIEECTALIEKVSKRVSHPAMIVLADQVPTPKRPRSDIEPATVNHGRAPNTERMAARAPQSSDPDEPLPTLLYMRAAPGDLETPTSLTALPGGPLELDDVQKTRALQMPPLLDAHTIIDPPRFTPVERSRSEWPLGERSNSLSLEVESARSTGERIPSERPTSAQNRTERFESSPPLARDDAHSRSDRPPADGTTTAVLPSVPPTPVMPSSPPGPPSHPPPFDGGTLSSRAAQMMEQASAAEEAEARARSKRVSKIAIAVTVALVGSVGLALLIRLVIAPATPTDSSTSRAAQSSVPAVDSARAAMTASAPTAVTSVIESPTPTATAAPTESVSSVAIATAAPSASSASPLPSASSAAKTKPTHVTSGPAAPVIPQNDGHFNPSSL